MKTWKHQSVKPVMTGLKFKKLFSIVTSNFPSTYLQDNMSSKTHIALNELDYVFSKMDLSKYDFIMEDEYTNKRKPDSSGDEES